MSGTRIKIPEHIKPYIIAQSCEDFPIQRYYLTDNVKEIVKSIKNTDMLSKEMDKLGAKYMNSTLLYGKPGIGKTMLGKYISYCLKKDFIYLNFAKIFTGSTGVAAGIIEDVFEFAKNEDCVFMIDEIDCISQERGISNDSFSVDRKFITTIIMQQFDKYRDFGFKCILLGATNHREIIDEALFSRFSVTKEIMPLNNQEKEEYICMFLKNLNYTSPDGRKGIPYDINNIKEYCRRNINVRQRNIESDINRCIATWIINGKKNFNLEHIQEIR